MLPPGVYKIPAGSKPHVQQQPPHRGSKPHVQPPPPPGHLVKVIIPRGYKHLQLM